ncbi:MAG: F0F1 ATP synthase subunit B' [Alphaproteobacteria bacterium]|nr:F0F1 ATP synthase subunit B' [Alphaproteobacteria bacterium]MBU6471367.1 F0F1 ATP synthase subunit B' [Alphaproteobacteria bacterium]MDE2012587.1 F0F1 ATP synthase subunit B' [Alphaproteobacteria bacterium]MDE2073452.1 F0F1 ATP synthase subunit B' [Alphaproteobacteria bacterium]MDE2350932.1 F0F1 ATP synthase subunit B' [Alphaproteobacteria bacterium]
MADTTATTSGTEVPSHQGGNAFPPFDTTTYASQIFWLTVTFVLLLVVMWRLGVRGIGGNIEARKGRIAGDLEAAEGHRKNADKASADYDTALAQARARAHALAEENRQHIQAEIDGAKARAEAAAQETMSQAEARIQATRAEAKAHVGEAAAAAAVAIVARLTGDSVSAEDAAAALGSR